MYVRKYGNTLNTEGNVSTSLAHNLVGLEMRILSITRRFPPAPGGVESQVEEICFELHKRGHEVTIYTSDLFSDIPFRRMEQSSRGNSNVLNVRRFAALPVPWREKVGTTVTPSMVVALMTSNVPKLVHAHGLNFVTLSASKTALRRKARIVFTTHHDPMLLNTRFVTHFLAKFHGIVALTEIERKQLLRLGVEQNRIRVIPNGIDLAAYSDLPSKDSFKKKNRVSNTLILYAGRIDVRKGCEVLVESVAFAQKRLGTCTLAFAGPDWGSREYLQRLAASRNVRAIFVGNLPREDLKEALVACDVFVLPSFEESFPTSILEAMICGAPVIATAVGGIPSLVHSEDTGLLVRPGQVSEIGDAIGRIVEDKALSIRLVSNARRFASEYSIDRTVSQLENFYRDILSL